MHSQAQLARLQSNRLAYAHFQKFKGTYARYAQDIREIFWKYPATTLAFRAYVVKAMILEHDPDIWGLGTASMTIEDTAGLFAALVVGHEI